ncbi:hypothetical protein RSOLAG1IB_04992 [Rhizoctonia solani AG-1 IB]|uniref:DUF202 domain-containing protein n=1 Tax=Thanatephorus cucumeris (strain AG1-IB / isolate 7/3/14) TaxID=1108050 RepID=A0A0B7FXI4_THACB|nr:hypothetical protein RSOLAG1IB_04992 [Rhizoctonia solani AG-1 IB]
MSEHCRTSISDPQRRVSFFERDPGIPVVSATPPSNDMTTARPEPSNSTTEEWDEYEEPNRKGFLGLVDKFSPQMVLENSGSVARDHLANERTWLAYVRTSLAIASTGVALVQLFTIAAQQPAGTVLIGAKLQRFARPLGAVIVAIGMSVLALGVNRYFKVQHTLTENKFPPARKTVAFISTVLAAIVAVVFGILVGVPRR